MKSYRIDQPKPVKPNRSMQDVSTTGRIYVHNGCTANLAIPCWYMEVRPPVHARHHNRMRHDMIGWPWPDKPDGCCQEWDFDRHPHRCGPHPKHRPPDCRKLIDMRRLIPIHLIDEGYSKVSVNVVDADGGGVDGISASGEIDENDDWIVRVSFDASVPGVLTPEDDPVECYYSVYLNMDSNGVRDLAAIGRLTVLPSPFGVANE